MEPPLIIFEGSQTAVILDDAQYLTHENVKHALANLTLMDMQPFLGIERGKPIRGIE